MHSHLDSAHALPVAQFEPRNQSGSGASLDRHIKNVLACRRCPEMRKPVVSCGPVVSKVMLVGQAPGDKEPVLGRPFAWTAGRTLFRWFEESCGLSEAQFRSAIYIAAVCRCFPGKRPAGGDRVPSKEEIANCGGWFTRELEILEPKLVIPVGKLAISQFLAVSTLNDSVGRQYQVSIAGRVFDLIPLPHPSGASPWHRVEPGKSLLQKALCLVRDHAAVREVMERFAGNAKHLGLFDKVVDEVRD